MSAEFINDLKRKFKRVAYGVMHLGAPRASIDWDAIKNASSRYNLKETTEALQQNFLAITLDKSENSEYFSNLLNYIGKARFLRKNPFYLYPSNVAIIDFLLKKASTSDIILDYGCGLGNLMVYLKKMGFHNAYGYDNFSQIKKDTVAGFLKKFNCEGLLISKESALSLPTTIAICSGFFWDKMGQDILEKEKHNKNLRYILVDYDYIPDNIEGFEIDQIYNNLLVVFKRKERHTIRNIIIYAIGGRIKRFCFKIYESFFPIFEIDRVLLDSAIARFGLGAVTSQLKSSYESLAFSQGDNREYFNNMLHWVDADKHLVANPLFLYPPNVAVMDFLLKNGLNNGNILDYGSGLSHLLVYLRKMGFANSFGYDDFSQISSQTISNFLKEFGLVDVILTKQQALAFKTNVALCICYFWSKLDKDLIEKEVNNPDVEYILLDYYYAPRHIKNFKIMGIYKNLLIVFKRIS